MKHSFWMTGHFQALMLLSKNAARWQKSAQHKHIINLTGESLDDGTPSDYLPQFHYFFSAFTFICLFLRLHPGLIIFPGHLVLSLLISKRYCFARDGLAFSFCFLVMKISII